jgi:prophage DNA circulation protein
MFKQEIAEAAPIVNETLKSLLVWVTTRGREGADLRTAVNGVRVNILELLRNNTLGPPLANCFQLAQTTGATLANIESVRITAAEQIATLPGSILIRDSLIQLCFVTQARILAVTEFVSREDVERVRATFNVNFAAMEEKLADDMDAMTYRAVVELHAAVSFFLVETARPLPRMLRFRFNLPLPSLVIAQKLYHDASRADELRLENKIVHPGFCQRSGRALSN